MDDREQLYLIWAPPDSPWSAWAKPVLFAHADVAGQSEAAADVSAVPPADGTTAVVVDLPGATGVATAVVLAGRGYRPVPLYNAVPGGAAAAVAVEPIRAALSAAAADLRSASPVADAPPAFVLDAGRRFSQVAVGPGVFDNRSVSLPTDFPSAERLRSGGVRRIVLVQATTGPPQADLGHTLRRWQAAGLPILRVATAEPGRPPVPINVPRPGGFRSMWHGLVAVAGLRRHPMGGFGGTLPVPSAG